MAKVTKRFTLKRLTSSWNTTRRLSSARIATKDRHEMATTQLDHPSCFQTISVLAPSPVHFDVGKLVPRKNKVFFSELPAASPRRSSYSWSNRQFEETLVDFHVGRHIVRLGTWGEPAANTIPGPFRSGTHRIGLGTNTQCPVYRGKRGWVLLVPWWEGLVLRRHRNVSWELLCTIRHFVYSTFPLFRTWLLLHSIPNIIDHGAFIETIRSSEAWPKCTTAISESTIPISGKNDKYSNFDFAKQERFKFCQPIFKMVTTRKPSSCFTGRYYSQVQKVHSTKFLQRRSKAKFFILCDVIFLVKLQGKFEIDHSLEWKG